MGTDISYDKFVSQVMFFTDPVVPFSGFKDVQVGTVRDHTDAIGPDIFSCNKSILESGGKYVDPAGGFVAAFFQPIRQFD